MLVFIKVTDYNKIVKKDKSARRWSVAMTEKKHAIKPYPLGAHVEDGAIRFAYASGKKDCGIILYDRESGKKLHKIPFRREERMGNVYCKYLELDPQQIGYQFYEEERRIFYVAMTRAKKDLELLCLTGTAERPRFPSRFLIPLNRYRR